ncbi:MAG: RIP metalloprotease RseP [Zoogloeaceae bacterium]|jgi:regulator of sigma E protease|nr:RIP metalloprotease RseP [Zoogloeaceae bacterium]
MTDAPLFVVAFLLLIAVLIVIHELGHFLVARLCGVKVLRFSLGFGKILWRRKWGVDQTEWTVCALPLGGYVKMLDEREADEAAPIAAAELPRAFNRQSVGKRIAIVAAGPLANFFLAILVYWLMFLHGSEALLPILGEPPAGTPAALAGIANGDRATRIGDTPVTTFEDFHWQVLRQASSVKSVDVELVNEQNVVRLARLDLSRLAAEGWRKEPFSSLGLRPYQVPAPAVIGEVTPEKPAAGAGIRTGDRIVAIDGQAVEFWYQMTDHIVAAAGRELGVTVLRQGEEIRLKVTPEAKKDGKGETVGFIGVGIAKPETPPVLPEMWTEVRYGVFEAATRSVRQTWETSALSLKLIGKIFTGEVSWRNLSGPVAIAEYAGKSARMGLESYLRVMALVSIGLGLLNLFPIPVLDGGHLMYYCLEVIKGRPVSERVMAWGQQFGLALLLTLMAFALFNDLSRLFG